MNTKRKRVFVSFDYDNDKSLKEFIIGQAKLPDSPFEASDWPLQVRSGGVPGRLWSA